MKRVFLTATSTAPFIRFSNTGARREWCYLVLSHDPDAVDMRIAGGGLLVLERHFGRAVGIIRDVIQSPSWTGGECEFLPEAGELADEAIQNMRRNMSGEIEVLESHRTGERDGLPLLLATRWRLDSVAFELTPGNPTVGINRRWDGQPQHFADEIENA